MLNYFRKLLQQAPQSGRVIGDNGTLQNWGDQMSRSFTSFNDLRTREETPQFVWKSVFDKSTLRDAYVEENGGTVTSTASEFKVSTTSTAGSVAQVQTLQRGDYIPGSEYVPGLGIRVPVTPTDAKIDFGYFDSNNGAFFRIADGSISVVQRRGGVEEVTPKSQWNIDRLDGSGNKNNPSGLSLNLSDGHVFRMPFLYYGYGYLRFEIGLIDRYGIIHRIIPVHIYTIENETSLQESNLPITVRVEGNGEAIDCYLGGRQMSVVGKNIKTFRTVSAIREIQSVGSSAWVPMVTVRQKVVRQNVFCELSNATGVFSSNVKVAVFRNATLNTSNFITPAGYDAGETATEWDITATSFTGGSLIAGPKPLAGGVANNGLGGVDLPDFPLLDGDTYTYALRKFTGVSGTNDQTLSATVRENW